MEAYKTTCSDCGHVRYWIGYKTGISKTPEQIAKMQADQTTCVSCGSKRATTTFDDESPEGQIYAAQARFLAEAIMQALERKDQTDAARVITTPADQPLD